LDFFVAANSALPRYCRCSQKRWAVGLLLKIGYACLALLTVATLANCALAFSALNWLLGRSIERYRNKRWFLGQRRQLEQAQRAYHRLWSLWSRKLLSWVPTHLATHLPWSPASMREPFWSFSVNPSPWPRLPVTVAGSA